MTYLILTEIFVVVVGFALCLKVCIEYRSTVRHGLIVLFNEYTESVFIKMKKKTLVIEKDTIIVVIYRIPCSNSRHQYQRIQCATIQHHR